MSDPVWAVFEIEMDMAHRLFLFISLLGMSLAGCSLTASRPSKAAPTTTPATTGVVVSGRIIQGSGDRAPVRDLPLRVDTEPPGDTIYTDEFGKFSLTDVPIGQTTVIANALTFQVVVTSQHTSVDLGLLKYPLIHPPNYYYWSAAALPSLSLLLEKGRSVEFSVCLLHLDWQRPSEQEQAKTVWSKPPFSAYAKERLRWWFERPAVIYNGVDQFSQGFPGGPNLDDLAADWRYLLGLWNGPDIITHSECVYDGQTLEGLLLYKQVEMWLIGYEAVSIQYLDKDQVGYDRDALCNPAERSCTERLGDHFAVRVAPIQGYQVIRFPGVQGVFAVHVVGEEGELIELPTRFE